MVFVDLIQETSEDFPFKPEELFQKVADEVLEFEKCPYKAEVSVSLVEDKEIRDRNRVYRKIDAVTDVLSFPLVPFPAPADYSFLEEPEARDCFDPETGALYLGDIVIACGRAKEQAAVYGHSITREFAFLTAHSMLHLLGYDHESPEEAVAMEMKQEQILQNLNITRDFKDE